MLHHPRRPLALLLLGLLLLTARDSAGKAPPPAAPPSRIERLGRVLALEDARTDGQGELDRLLRDPDRGIRRRAALAAGRIASREAIPALVEMMNDGEPEVRQMAAFSLGLIGDTAAVERLVGGLKDSEGIVRARSAEALGRIADPRVAEPLVAYIRSTTPRVAGTNTVTVRGDDPGNPNDPWAELRLGLLALTRLKDAKAAEAILLQGRQSKFDWWVSAWVASRMELPSLAPVLTQAAQSNDVLSRIYAAKGLGALKDPSSAPGPRRSRQGPERDRCPHGTARTRSDGRLQGRPDRSGRPRAPRIPWSLREALRALALPPGRPIPEAAPHTLRWPPRAFVRGAALMALARASQDEFTLVLSGLDSDPDFTVRAAIASALGDVGDPMAVGVLFGMLKDPDPRVLPAVLEAFVRRAVTMLSRPCAPTSSMPTPLFAPRPPTGVAALGAKGMEPALLAAWHRSRNEADLDARLAVVDALATLGSADSWSALGEIAAATPCGP